MTERANRNQLITDKITEDLRELNETDTEVSNIMSPTKKYSELDENVKEKRYDQSVRCIKSVETRNSSTLTFKEKKMERFKKRELCAWDFIIPPSMKYSCCQNSTTS